MRLLNVHDFELESGVPDPGLSGPEAKLWSQTSSAIPQYAILSHRWVDGEEITFDKLSAVSKARFRDIPSQNLIPQHGHTSSLIEKHASSVYKIAGACQQVRMMSEKAVRHIWIDAICIDKSNVQELSIAINSMFQLYENAEVCYVYLFDVSWTSANDTSSRKQFVESQWFKRGW
jgi:hypothetical protein